MTELSEGQCQNEITRTGWHIGLDGRWKKLPRSRNYNTAKDVYEAEFEPFLEEEAIAAEQVARAGWQQVMGKWRHSLPSKPMYDSARECAKAELTPEGFPREDL